MASSSSSIWLFATALLFVMLFMATEIGSSRIMVVEARACESQSQKYKGTCDLGDSNCNVECRAEGFLHGDCRGYAAFNRRCICMKPC